MDFFYWFQIAIAVVFGNTLTASVIFFFYKVSKHEKQGQNAETLPPWVFLTFLIPAGCAFVAVFLLT